MCNTLARGPVRPIVLRLILKLVWECNCPFLLMLTLYHKAAQRLPETAAQWGSDTWSASIISVKVWVMVPRRLRPAQYSATLDVQWGLLSLHFPWSWTATILFSLERPLQKWVVGIQPCFSPCGNMYCTCYKTRSNTWAHSYTQFNRALRPFSWCYID